MNQLNRALLLPSSMIVVVVMVVSNIMFMSLLSPSNTSGLGSNIVVYNPRELVTISVLFLVLIGLLILLTRTLRQRTKRRRTFSTQTKKLILRNQNFKCVKCRVNAGIGILITRMGTGQTTRRPIVKHYADMPRKVEA